MDREIILLNDRGTQHLVVPAIRGCGMGWLSLKSQCDISDGLGLTPVDFTSRAGETGVYVTGAGGGRGDVPMRFDGKSLDAFTTSCSMGDHTKRGLALDSYGHRLMDNSAATLCSTQGLCDYPLTDGYCVFDSSHACQAKIEQTGLYANCAAADPDDELLNFNAPPGYEYVSSQVCQLNEIDDHTNLGANIESSWLTFDLKGCNYNYRKDWDHDHWQTPGEILDVSVPSPPGQTGPVCPQGSTLAGGSGLWCLPDPIEALARMYNSNNIPIKRMECCIGHRITEEDVGAAVDVNECPVDTNAYQFHRIHGTEGGSIVEPADGETQVGDRIRAYTPDSLMCDGRSSTIAGIDPLKTPQHWCTYFMQSDFNIDEYPRYYSLLNDKHCQHWLQLDAARAGQTDKYREISYMSNLSEFYLWISHNLAYDYELKPYKHHGHVPIDNTIELNMNNRSDFSDDTTGYNFNIANDYGKFISLLKIKAGVSGHHEDPPLVKMFLDHAEKADRVIFNENMEIFCNRRDIFNFKDRVVDANTLYNIDLEEKYKDLCACYWDKNIDFTPTNQMDDFYQMLHSIHSHSHSSDLDQIALAISTTLDLTLKNQCWYNGCIGNVGGIQLPYKEGISISDDIHECPDRCIGIALAESMVLLNDAILEGTNIDVSAIAEVNLNCEQGNPSADPAPIIAPLSEINRLLDNHEESNPGTGAGGASGNTDKISIVIKIFYLLLFIIAGYKALSFIVQ